MKIYKWIVAVMEEPKRKRPAVFFGFPDKKKAKDFTKWANQNGFKAAMTYDKKGVEL